MLLFLAISAADKYTKSKRKFADNHFHNILKLFDLYQYFALQVKRCAIFNYKHGVYELPHKLPNNLKLRFLGD